MNSRSELPASRALFFSVWLHRSSSLGSSRRIPSKHTLTANMFSPRPSKKQPGTWRRRYVLVWEQAKKADVYSSGVLMIEIVTGRRPSWPVKNIEGKEVDPLKWAREKVEEGVTLEIVDRRMGIGGEGMETEEVKSFLDVAVGCTRDSPTTRPAMKEVVEAHNKL